MVIGTLWHASDKYCADVGTRPYQDLVTVDGGKIDFDWAPSGGLHLALRFLSCQGATSGLKPVCAYRDSRVEIDLKKTRKYKTKLCSGQLATLNKHVSELHDQTCVL